VKAAESIGAETTSRPLAARVHPRGSLGFLDIGGIAWRAPDSAADIGQRHRPRGPLQQPRPETILHALRSAASPLTVKARACAPPAQNP